MFTHADFLKLNVEPSGMSLNLEVPLEIIIGTIPLRQVVELCPPRAPQPFQPPVGFPLPTEAVNISGMDGGSVIPSAPFEPVMPYQPPSHIPNLRM